MKRLFGNMRVWLAGFRTWTRRELGRKSVAWIAGLSAVVIVLEVAQGWPEFVQGGHVASVFGRDIIYSIIAAMIFNLIMVDIPQRRRARAIYEYNRNNFEVLFMLGPSHLILYDLASTSIPYDPWNWESVRARAKLIYEQQPSYFDSAHRGEMQVMIQAIHEALSEIRYAQSFLSIEVSQAVAMFPSANGLNQLQVDEQPDGSISWHRDAHICWSTTEGARRLYGAIKSEFPDLEFRRGEVVLESGETFEVPESMYVHSE